MAVITNLDQYLQTLGRKIVGRAAARAMNRAIVSAKAEAARIIREQNPALKIGDIKKAIVEKKAKPNDNLRNVFAYLEMEKKGIGLDKFQPRRKKIKTARGARYGVTVKFKSGRKLIPGAFMGTSRSGATMIFRRKGSDRLPIKRLYGPSPSQIIGYDALRRRLLKYGSDVYAKNFQHELDYQLSRIKPSGEPGAA
jgi:hypothetical protein